MVNLRDLGVEHIGQKQIIKYVGQPAPPDDFADMYGTRYSFDPVECTLHKYAILPEKSRFKKARGEKEYIRATIDSLIEDLSQRGGEAIFQISQDYSKIFEKVASRDLNQFRIAESELYNLLDNDHLSPFPSLSCFVLGIAGGGYLGQHKHIVNSLGTGLIVGYIAGVALGFAVNYLNFRLTKRIIKNKFSNNKVIAKEVLERLTVNSSIPIPS